MAMVGLPPGRFALPIFETVLKRITVRGSIVGTLQDLEEALDFAGEDKVAPHFSWDSLCQYRCYLRAHGARQHRWAHRAAHDMTSGGRPLRLLSSMSTLKGVAVWA